MRRIAGGVGYGDIGEHFPDSDPAYKGIAGSRLLEPVKAMLEKSRYMIGNIDIVLVAQSPALTPFKKKIKENLCSLMDIEDNALNIKAKTNEGLDAVGNQEAIACWAVSYA